MVKPMGAVAILTLFITGTAMSSEFINTRQVNTWG